MCSGGSVSSATEMAHLNVPIEVTVNGVEHATTVEPRTLLVYFLRESLGLTGTLPSFEELQVLEQQPPANRLMRCRCSKVF